MTHVEIREKFLKFFEERGHKIVPSSSLLPTDPSVLFTTAGMQQFKPYYTGEADPMKDFGSLNTVSIQKSMRTSDIDEVGDESHLTFFEMLGNFSFGGYWKKGAIEYAHEFITKEMGLKIDYVSVFGGEGDVPADEESEKIWKSIDPEIEVKKFGRADNFWGPTGNEGPCGPTSEIYVNGVEIWNLVFNEYYCTNGSQLEPLKIRGIDTGMGLERLAMVVQKKNNIFETDLLLPLIKEVRNSNPHDYKKNERTERIIADHARAIIFLVSDGVEPSNKQSGYVLRRLLRRLISSGYISEINSQKISRPLFNQVFKLYKNYYHNLNLDLTLKYFDIEDVKVQKSYPKGIREMKKFLLTKIPQHPGLSEIKYEEIAKNLFNIKQTFGLDFDVIYDILFKSTGPGLDMRLLKTYMDKEFTVHREISRAGAEKKFGGHGLILDTGELKAGNEEELKKATRLHTATHLLHASLRKILGLEVKQAGSDITAERLRFDFTFPRKMTPDEIKQVENLINEAVQKDYQVTKKEMPYEEAIKSGALAFFKLKYPPIVNVFTIGGTEPAEVPFSRELCGGPHVTHTGEIGKFKIAKEEAISAGTRRIRAVVE
ncbi:MAG: alanine--tRNA ligase-related protein [Patescibacteria group bacterium]